MNAFICIGLFCFSIILSQNISAQKTDSLSAKKIVESVDFKSNKKVTVTYKDGSTETMSDSEATKKGLIHNGGYGNQANNNSSQGDGHLLRTNPSATQPLIVLDGKEITEEEMKAIKPETIESINVLKDKNSTDKYGVKGRKGVVEIITKNKLSQKDEEEVVVFQKVEIEPYVDRNKWEKFLGTYVETIQTEMTGKIPDGQYYVCMKFVVDKDGSVTDAEIINDPGYGLGKKVSDIMQYSPKWTPGEVNGRIVKMFTRKAVKISIGNQINPVDQLTVSTRVPGVLYLGIENIIKVEGMKDIDFAFTNNGTIQKRNGDFIAIVNKAEKTTIRFSSSCGVLLKTVEFEVKKLPQSE